MDAIKIFITILLLSLFLASLFAVKEFIDYKECKKQGYDGYVAKNLKDGTPVAYCYKVYNNELIKKYLVED